MIFQTIKSKYPWVVGHRGAMGYAPENSPASFELALKLGADALECDVHLSKDGRCVIIHDEALERTTNGNGLVIENSSKKIAALDCGLWYSPNFKGQTIWFLEDLLTWAKNKITIKKNPLCLIIEIKNDPIRYLKIEDKVLKLVKQHEMQNRCIFISFDHGVVKRLKRLDKKNFCGILYDRKIEDPIYRAHQMLADGFFPRRNLLDRATVSRAHREKLFIGTWTVNQTTEIKNILKMKPDMITTNVPDILIKNYELKK